MDEARSITHRIRHRGGIAKPRSPSNPRLLFKYTLLSFVANDVDQLTKPDPAEIVDRTCRKDFSTAVCVLSRAKQAPATGRLRRRHSLHSDCGIWQTCAT